MSNRITLETLRSGQPRAYADSERVVRITYEYTPWNDKNGAFRPWVRSKSDILGELPVLKVGFIPTPKSEAGMLGSYLDYLRPVSPDERGNSAVWEFRVVSPFTD